MKLGKILFVSSLSFFPLLQFASAATDPAEFTHFPAPKTVETCKDLDFNSYFRAQDYRKHLIKDNPDRSKPNFGGKYLLLKQEMMMETLWLIADCETGKIFHETLSGLAEFKPDSLLLVLTKPKSSELPQYQVWKSEDWVRMDAPSAPQTATTAVAEVKTPPAPSPAVSSAWKKAEETYSALFKKYPEPLTEGCKDLDFNSYFRAQGAKNNLIKLNPDRSKPNFAGKYLLLRNDVLFERLWLIADCTTGKFFPEFIKSDVEFKPDSALVLVRHSSEYARLTLWRDHRFVDLLNPVRTGKQEIENKVYDQDAADLLAAAGAPKNEPRFRFEDLKCIGQNCSVRIFPDAQPKALSPEQAKLAEVVLKKWGGEFQEGAAAAFSIESGICTRQKSYPVCDIKLSR